METVEREEMDGRGVSLPLARIKKVMKSDEEVKVGLGMFLCTALGFVDADVGCRGR